MEQTAPAPTPTSAPEALCKVTSAGIVGLTVALLALAAAALSPWVVRELEPEPTPIDEVAADVAVRINDRLAARAQGREYVPPPAEPEPTHWSEWYPAGVVAAGVLAIGIGVVGLVLHHDARLNTATVAVGAAAIVFQYFLIIAAVLLLFLLIGLVVSAIGGGS